MNVASIPSLQQNKFSQPHDKMLTLALESHSESLTKTCQTKGGCCVQRESPSAACLVAGGTPWLKGLLTC